MHFVAASYRSAMGRNDKRPGCLYPGRLLVAANLLRLEVGLEALEQPMVQRVRVLTPALDVAGAQDRVEVALEDDAPLVLAVGGEVGQGADLDAVEHLVGDGVVGQRRVL